jgi:hypothetical protein
MGYYIRVLAASADEIPIGALREAAKPALIEIATGSDNSWSELILTHASGDEIAIIERNPVIDDELGAEEIAEFIEEVAECKPRSAAAWLQQYLPAVKVIYAFQLLGGTEIDDGWAPLHSVHAKVWNLAGGILQSDGEGFSNEDGCTILWQFSDSVKGRWKCAALRENGEWIGFEMDLGDLAQRTEFKNGRVPSGAKLL